MAVQDFALEADESRMRNGAHLMAGSLSGSLALVTGREPLRLSLLSQLRAMLANQLDGPTLESAILVTLPIPSQASLALLPACRWPDPCRAVEDVLKVTQSSRASTCV